MRPELDSYEMSEGMKPQTLWMIEVSKGWIAATCNSNIANAGICHDDEKALAEVTAVELAIRSSVLQRSSSCFLGSMLDTMD